MKEVGIIDFGVGNLRSVANAVQHLGAKPVVSNDIETLVNCDALIFPGVGAFSYGIEALKEYGLDDLIKSAQDANKPLLGICLGMQLLFETSHEFGEHTGLNLIPGNVTSFADVSKNPQNLRLPNVGWISVDQTDKQERAYDWLFDGISEEAKFYFIHSYHVSADNQNAIATSQFQNHSFAAIVGSGSVIGTQFHPEKSGPSGLRMLKNFLNWRPAA